MEVPKYIQILWSYKWLLLFGLLVSIVAGLLAGFTIRDGELEPRVKASYTAATTVMLSSRTPQIYQVEVPQDQVDPLVVTPTKQEVSLSESALIYAYLVSSLQIRDEVEARIGVLGEDEDITGQARTTQPGEDSATTNTRLSLPLIEVVGIAPSPARAEEISATANEVFQEFVVAQQAALAVPENIQVVLTTLRSPQSDDGVGANPAIPVAVAFLGSMMGFVALAYLLYAGQKTAELRRLARARRKRQRDGERLAAAGGESAETSEASDLFQATDDARPSSDDIVGIDGNEPRSVR